MSPWSEGTVSISIHEWIVLNAFCERLELLRKRFLKTVFTFFYFNFDYLVFINAYVKMNFIYSVCCTLIYW